MKLESLKLDKFKNNVLKKEQMFNLNGGGCKTAGGWKGNCINGETWVYSYGYDVDRGNGMITFHDRQDYHRGTPENCG